MRYPVKTPSILAHNNDILTLKLLLLLFNIKLEHNLIIQEGIIQLSSPITDKINFRVLFILKILDNYKTN